jgi:hypothetical protein
VAIVIGESWMTRLTETGVAVSAGVEESATVTMRWYVAAVAGVPDSCPLGLKDMPAGRAPVSDQVKGATPPLATVNVNPV